ISRPIVLTSPMDGSPQVVRFDATTLWHLDAAEWAPSTASKAALVSCRLQCLVCPKGDIDRRPPRFYPDDAVSRVTGFMEPALNPSICRLPLSGRPTF